jgi:hypothetical protein
MNIEVSFEWMGHVSAEIYAKQKRPVSFSWPPQSHPALLQLKLYEYTDCLTVVASHCTHQMQPPNAAIVRPLEHNIHVFFYNSKIDGTAWTATDDITYHIIGGYAIPKGCNTKTVMNTLKKSVVDHYVSIGAHFTPQVVTNFHESNLAIKSFKLVGVSAVAQAKQKR